MPRLVGKVQTTDLDGIVAYGDNIATSNTDNTPINKRIPQVYYAFNNSNTQTMLYRTAEDYTAGTGISSTSETNVPVNTIIFITSEGNAYIRLTNKPGGLPNYRSLTTSESKIYSSYEEASAYAAQIGEIGEIITVIDTANTEVNVYKINLSRELEDIATSFLVQLYSTGASTSYTLTLGQSLTVGFVYNEKYGTDSTGQPGTIIYQIKRPSDENFVTISSPSLVTSIACSTGDSTDPTNYHPMTFDPSDYGYEFAEGNNIIQITVIGGESKKSKSIQFNINVIAMYVATESTWNDSVVKSQSAITYPWRCYGDGVNKTVYLVITDDSTGATYTYTTDVGVTNGVSKYTIITPNTIFNKSFEQAHGTYTMEQYCVITETIGTANEIRSESIKFNIMYCPSMNTFPLISATIDKTAINYGDIIHIQWAIYSYSTSSEYTNTAVQTLYYYEKCLSTDEGAIELVDDTTTPTASQMTISDTGIDLATVNLVPGDYARKVVYVSNNVTFRNGATKATWNISDYPDTTTAKTIFLEITCTNQNDQTATKTFRVSLGSVSGNYDLSPADVPTYLYLSSNGKTNSDTTRISWQTPSSMGTMVKARLTNLNYISNGWIEDSENVICLRLSGGATCVIPLVINDNYMYYENAQLNDETGGDSISSAGRTFIIDFNIHDVLNYSADCITWYSETDGRGLKVTPSATYFVNEGSTVEIDSSGAITNKDDIAFVQIKDNQRLQLAIVIENSGASVGTEGHTTQFIRMYLNGELSKAISFENYLFTQTSLSPLTIGSEDAVIDVYSVRSYMSPLCDYQILQNYISDRPTIKDKMEAYDANNIYSPVDTTSSKIKINYSAPNGASYADTRKLYPCCLVTGEFSPIKGTKTKVGIVFTKPSTNAEGFTTELNCMDYYTVGDSSTKKYLCETNVQGTSSQIYAKKNYKFKFANIKSSAYTDSYSYYVKESDVAGAAEYYCEYSELNFFQDYRPGASDAEDAPWREYWEQVTTTVQNDTYSPLNTYIIGDLVYRTNSSGVKYQYRCIKAVDYIGGPTDEFSGDYMFVPHIETADTYYLVCNLGATENERYYFVQPGESLVYMGYDYAAENTIAGCLISDSRVVAKSQISTNVTTGGKYVTIGANDSIQTSKTKYTLYPNENYRGMAESTVCVKADYMSPDGINSDNGRMFPKLFQERVPPQQNNPYGADNNKVFIAIPGFRFLMFKRSNESEEPVFWGRYNFNYDKGNTKSFGLENDGDEDSIGILPDTKCQKWEYLDNKEDICNFKSYKLFQPITNNGVTQLAAYSSLESCYPDQGDLEDAGRSPNYYDLQVLYSWVLQRANFWEASTEQVAVPYEYNGTYYYNERAYKKAIFLNEFERHFNKNHALTYHICVEVSALVDNRAKNMFLTCYDRYHNTNIFSAEKQSGSSTSEALAASNVNIAFTSGSISSVADIIDMDTGEVNYNLIDWESSTFPIWYTSLYDMDSCYGCDNNGKNKHNYDVEIHDIYNYDSTGQPTYCFNGATSYLWCMIEEAFADDIKALYNSLRQQTGDTPATLSYESLCEEYMTNGVDTIPQVVYNEDQRFKFMDIATIGYLNVTNNQWQYDTAYQYLCQGSKRYHKRWFIENRMAFLDSKYMSPQYKANNISFRINRGTATSVSAAEVAIDITPFITQYQYVAYGNAGETYFGGKCEAGNTIHIQPTVGGVYQDIVFTIYGANNISDLGDLSNFYLSKINLTNASKLKTLKIGSSTTGYANPNLVSSEFASINNSPLLQKLDITNVTGLTQSLDLSRCGLLKEVYANGTNLNSISFPNGGNLNIISLPSTISTLDIRNQKFIQSLFIAGYDNLVNLNVENVDGNIDIPFIIESAPNLRRVRCTNVNWVLPDKTVLNKLMSCGGLMGSNTTSLGQETTKAVLTGTVVVQDASSVNLELWKEYWSDYIADMGGDGSLTIQVNNETDFYYVTYCTFGTGANAVQITEGIDANGNTIQKAYKMVPEQSSAIYWYTEPIDVDPGMGNNQTYGKNNYRPVLISAQTNVPLVDESLPEVNTSIEQKNTSSASYWCIDDQIVNYSPDNFYLALFPIEGDGIAQLPVVDNDGNPIKFRKIVRDDVWALNDSTATRYAAINYKAVLKDNNGNIVYTAKNSLSAEPVDGTGIWYDTDGDASVQVIIDGHNCEALDAQDIANGETTNKYTGWLVRFDEIPNGTFFIDAEEDSEFVGTFPTPPATGMMFSHWSPSEKNISSNKYIYAQFINGYNASLTFNPMVSQLYTVTPYETDVTTGTTTAWKINGLVTAIEQYMSTNSLSELVIPAYHSDGKPIKAIGDAVFANRAVNVSHIQKVYFQTGSLIESIGEECFKNSTSIQTIEIPGTVTHIGKNAFYGVTANILWTGSSRMTNIEPYAFSHYNYGNATTKVFSVPSQPVERTIPDSIVNINEHAFEYSNVTIKWAANSLNKTIGDNAFYYSTMPSIVLSPMLETIGAHAFDHASVITSIVIPNTVKSIDSYAFYYASSLATVTFDIGSAISRIGEGNTIFDHTAFAGEYSSAATHTTAAWVPSTTGATTKVLYAGPYLICAESNVASVTAKSGTTLIAESAFEGNTTLTTLAFDDSANIDFINKNAFKGCTSLSTVQALPDTVDIISESAFEGCTSIASITIGASTDELCDRVFANCTSLASITLNSGLTKIGNYTFYNTALTSIVIPESVTHIGEFCFNKSNSLTSMTVPFVGKTNTSNGTYDSVFGYFFGYQINPIKVAVGDVLKGRTIYFDKSKTYTSTDHGSTLLSVDLEVTGSDNVNIAKIVNENGTIKLYYRKTISGEYQTVIQIGTDSSITETSFTFPSDVTEFNYTVTTVDTSTSPLYVYNKDYCDLKLETNVTPTTQYFSSTGYEEYYIPTNLATVAVSSATFIPRGAFYGMSNMTSVSINTTITEIKDYAFYGSGITGALTLSLLTDLDTIGDHAFDGMTSMTTCSLPNGLETIGAYCFNGCTSLSTLSIPSTLMNIGTNCFDGCPDTIYNDYENTQFIGNTSSPYIWAIKAKLKTYTTYKVNANTIGIYYGCYEDCTSMTSFEIASNIRNIYDRAFKGCTALSAITCSSSNATFYASNGVLYLGNSTTQTELVAYPAGKSNATAFNLKPVTKVRAYACYNVANSVFDFPEGCVLTEIGHYAFNGCAGLGNITLGSQIKNIEDHMFYNCSTAKIRFASSIESLGESSFENCAYLSNPVLSNSITTIPTRCFYGCSRLITSADFVIPASVSAIGAYAFVGVTSTTHAISFEQGSAFHVFTPYCFKGLNTVTMALPATITEIQHHAFYQCGFQSIIIPDTVASMGITTFKIGEHAFEGSSNLISVTINSSACQISSKAFYNCTKLATVDISNCSNPSNMPLSDIDAFGSNAVDRLIVVRDGTMSSYIGAGSVNWPSYEIYIVEKTDYEVGVSTFVITPTMGMNPSISMIKYTTPKEVYDQSTGTTSIVQQKDLTTVIWGDGYVTYTSKASEAGEAVTLYRAYYQDRNYYDAGYSHDNYTLSNSEYVTTQTTTPQGTPQTVYTAYGYGYTGNRTGNTVEQIASLPETYTIKVINRGAWKLNSSNGILNSGTNNAKITSAIIDGNITEYSHHFFTGATSLESVTLPGAGLSKYTTIKTSFFYGCTSLETVIFPTSVKTIESSAFYGCTALANINISGIITIGSNAFAGCTALSTILLEEITSLGSYAFSNCSNLGKVVIRAEDVPTVYSTTF